MRDWRGALPALRRIGVYSAPSFCVLGGGSSQSKGAIIIWTGLSQTQDGIEQSLLLFPDFGLAAGAMGTWRQHSIPLATPLLVIVTMHCTFSDLTPKLRDNAL
jgi:hypothetical protein